MQWSFPGGFLTKVGGLINSGWTCVYDWTVCMRCLFNCMAKARLQFILTLLKKKKKVISYFFTHFSG